jgi:hypothetical protein
MSGCVMSAKPMPNARAFGLCLCPVPAQCHVIAQHGLQGTREITGQLVPVPFGPPQAALMPEPLTPLAPPVG